MAYMGELLLHPDQPLSVASSVLRLRDVAEHRAVVGETSGDIRDSLNPKTLNPKSES